MAKRNKGWVGEFDIFHELLIIAGLSLRWDLLNL